MTLSMKRGFSPMLAITSALMLFIASIISGCAGESENVYKRPAGTVQIKTQDTGVIMQNIISTFTERVEARSGATVSQNQPGELTIVFNINSEMEKESFNISAASNNTITISGGDYRGLLYGAGKLLRASQFSETGFTPGAWTGTSVPDKKVRGIYFATHFYNYYQTAPVEEVRTYIEDLALWGVNNLMVWYDMHHFKGLKDPEAQALHNRIVSYMETAKGLDLDISFIVIGNEGYANSPQHLRSVPGGARGGEYPGSICPNKPGGIEYISGIMGEYFDQIKHLSPDYICVWPYDQGGCGGSCCQPWGSNGFLKCVREISSLARQKIPDVKIIVSTWYFDETEWQGFKDELNSNKELADMLLAENIEGYHNIAADRSSHNVPVVGFPEISMHQTFPWGGFGATPLTARVKEQWDAVRNNTEGGFPYSEGIFEDISKIVSTRLHWDSSTPVDSIVAEYIRYEFHPDVVKEVADVIKTLETNHHFRWWPGKLEGVKLQLDWFPSENVKPQEDPGAEEAYEIMKEADRQLPEWAAKSWRWRLLFIRSMLDAELKKNKGTPNQECINGFKELMQIYHTTKNSDPVVKPPIKEYWPE